MSKLVRMAACVGAIVCAMVVGSAAGAANLVQNGSFEAGYPGDNICGAWWYTVGYGCDPAGTAIPGWLETGDGVDWHNVGPPGEPVAQDGEHLVDLIGGGAGKIEQDVPTTTGGTYTLSFYYTTHSLAACSAPLRSATVTAGSSTLGVASEPSNVWKPASLVFAGAAGSTTTISFASNENFGCGGVVIDNVSVEAALPTTAAECKNGGWQTFGVFKNQGDCVSFVATGGRNEPGKNV